MWGDLLQFWILFKQFYLYETNTHQTNTHYIPSFISLSSNTHIGFFQKKIKKAKNPNPLKLILVSVPGGKTLFGWYSVGIPKEKHFLFTILEIPGGYDENDMKSRGFFSTYEFKQEIFWHLFYHFDKRLSFICNLLVKKDTSPPSSSSRKKNS